MGLQPPIWQRRRMLTIVSAILSALIFLAFTRQSYATTHIKSFLAPPIPTATPATTPTTTATPISTPTPPSPREAAANSTLGFERLLALSIRPSWRTRGIEAAAALTGLNFTIPTQPHNPDELVHSFQQIGTEEDAHPPDGSAKAWLAHLDLLKYIIASGFESALIVEDDVDWDVRIKDQTALLSDNIRRFLDLEDEDSTPYGTDWDVLWLGHCGSAVDAELADHTLTYPDETRFPNEGYFGIVGSSMQENIEDGHRAVHKSIFTVCTFAYAVTKKSAQKLLDLSGKAANEAFDIKMHALCRDGDLRCVVVNPELFGQYEPPEDTGYVSPVKGGDGKGEAEEKPEFDELKGTSRNILQSARCEALFHDVCSQNS